MTAIKRWFEAQGGFAHVAAGAYAFLVAAYALVPAFQAGVLEIYGATPHWLHQMIAGVVGIVAFYMNTRKKSLLQ